MRLFGSPGQTVTFSDDRNVTILVGNNGSGKSTILDAIAVEMSSFISNFQGQSAKQFSDTDIHFNDQEQYGDYLQVGASFSTTYNGLLEIVRTRQGREKAPEGTLKNVKAYAEELIRRVNGNDDIHLPVLAYYGTGRGQIKAPTRKRDFKKAFTRWDAYSNALEADTNFKRFIEWFDLMEDEERREREERWEKGYKNKALETVRTALNTFVGDRFSNPRMELHPLRFVMDETTPDGKKRTLRIEQMSDGYKIITAMVADIASRMAELNPGMANPLESTGIVLIDEIDLHLHPKWQRTVIESLTKTFPNVQFIATTHSPILISGAMDIAQLIVLGGEQIIDVDASKYDRYDVSQILLSDLFGLQSTRAPRWDEPIQEHMALLEKTDRTPEEDKRLKELDKILSNISYGETSDAIRSRELIYKIAAEMGIQ